MNNFSNNHSNASSKLFIYLYFKKIIQTQKRTSNFIQKLIRKLKTSKTTLNFLHLQTGLEEERPAGLSIPA